MKQFKQRLSKTYIITRVRSDFDAIKRNFTRIHLLRKIWHIFRGTIVALV